MVFIYGAYGFTGKQVVEFLSKTKVDYIISGRNEEKLKEIFNKISGNKPREYIAVSTEKISSLRMNGINLVVNTAGPFLDIGQGVLDFAYNNQANYIDCSGESFWAKKLIDQYSGKFFERSIFLSSGVAWETVAGELTVKKLIREVGAENVRGKTIYLVYLAEFNMSPGTLQSSINIIGRGAMLWNKGTVKIVNPFERRFRFEFKNKNFLATNISSSDVLNVPLSLGEIQRDIDFEILFATKREYFIGLMKLFSNLAKYKIFADLIKKVLDRFPEPDEARSPASALAFLLDGDKVLHRTVIDSKRPYRTTAKIMSYFIERFSEGKVKSRGYRAPTDLVDFPEEILTSD